MPTTETNDALPLNNYFAVQSFSGERSQEALQAVFTASVKTRKFFRRFEVLSFVTMGSNLFIRCRSDQPEMSAILDEVLETGHGVIARREGTYIAKLHGGRTGSVDRVKMHSEACPVPGGGRRLYKGTKIVGWQRQFEP